MRTVTLKQKCNSAQYTQVHRVNRYGDIAGETAKFLLECNVKLGRQQRGCWQQQSQIDDHLETEFGLRVCLGQNKNT